MIIILNPVDTLGFGKRKRRERRESAAAAAGAPTPSGAFCFCWTVPEFGATVANLRATPGGRIKWGGIYLLNPTFNPRPSPMDKAIKSPGDGTFRERREGGSAKNKGTVSLERVVFCFPSLFRFVVSFSSYKTPALCAFP